MRQLTKMFLLLMFLICLSSPALPQAPAINSGGVVNAADYTQSFSPGMMISIFGSNLAPATELATNVPLPTVLAGASVEVTSGGATVEAPLFFVSATQINAQLPYGLAGGQVQVRVKNDSGQSNAETIDIGTASPRLFTQTMNGLGEAILVHSDYSVVTLENPARAGEWVVLYLTGLGEVSPAIAAGQPAGDGGGGGELNRVTENVAVNVNSSPAHVYFAGLAPYFVGLYQINFQVPENAVPGMANISVQLGGNNSQESITFGCAVAYEQLTSAIVGSEGGTVAAGGFSAKIPAGALLLDTQITLHRVTGGTAGSNDPDDPIFSLEGIPDDYNGSLTITMEVPGDPSAAGEGQLVMIEEGGVGGEIIAETEVVASTATATIQAGGGKVAQSSSSSGPAKAARRYYSSRWRYQHWQWRNRVGHKLSPSGHFSVSYKVKDGLTNLAYKVGVVLDYAEEAFLAAGYRWKEPTEFPIRVTLAPLKIFEYGVVKFVTWDDSLQLQIDPLDGEWSDEGAAVSWGGVLLELFHLQYDLTTRLDEVGEVTPWTWWHWAVKEDFRGLVLSKNGASRDNNFLFKNPLQLPATAGGATRYAVAEHSDGAANFIGHLHAVKNTGWVQSVLDHWTPDNTPIDASIAAGINVSKEWLEFCRQFSEGAFPAEDLFGRVHDTEDVMIERSLTNIHWLDEESMPTAVTWATGRDLMADVGRFEVAHKWPEKSSLIVSLPSGGSDIVARVFEHSGSDAPQLLGEITGGELLEIPDFDQYQGTSLVVMLINRRAVRPYDGITSAQVRLEVKESDEGDEELSEVVGWLRACKKVIIQLYGIKGTCTSPSGSTGSCATPNITIRSWLNNTDTLLNVNWEGREFSWEGTIDTPWESPVRVYQSGSGTMSADGLTFEGGTFSDTVFYPDGRKTVRELEIIGPLPWAGVTPPFKFYSSYSYRVEGRSVVPQYVVKATYRTYNADGETLYHEMTAMEYTTGANIDLMFQKN